MQCYIVLLDPEKENRIEVGEECSPIQDIYTPSPEKALFYKGFVYKVIAVCTSDPWGYYLINELGQNHFLHFENRGYADVFLFLSPRLPSLEKEIKGWELCNKMFSDELLSENLKSIRLDMLNIYSQALEQA